MRNRPCHCSIVEIVGGLFVSSVTGGCRTTQEVEVCVGVATRSSKKVCRWQPRSSGGCGSLVRVARFLTTDEGAQDVPWSRVVHRKTIDNKGRVVADEVVCPTQAKEPWSRLLPYECSSTNTIFLYTLPRSGPGVRAFDECGEDGERLSGDASESEEYGL